MWAKFTIWLTCADVGQHKALVSHANSEHKGVHRDEPRPNLQPYSGIGWLVIQLSFKFPEQSKAPQNFWQDHWTMLVT